MMKVFEGLKVVELAGVLAGPAAGMFFAELGARVIKVENKATGGDSIRTWKLPEEKSSSKTSAYYHSVNWGKEVMMLDFDRTDDLFMLHGLLQEADIVLVNFKPGSARKWKLDHKSLRLQYPSLIIGEIRGFKNDGRIAYDAVLQAETGYLSINGTPASGPLKMPVAFIDLFAGHQLKEGLLIALMERMKSGKGALVSVSLEEAAIASLANQAAAWLNAGKLPGPAGSLHPVIAPYGETFRLADENMVLLAVGTDGQFAKLCELLGVSSLADDPRFANNPERVKNRTELARLLSPEFATRESGLLMADLIAHGVPAGLVKNMQQVFDTLVAKEMILEQQEEDTLVSKRVSTVVFSIQRNP